MSNLIASLAADQAMENGVYIDFSNRQNQYASRLAKQGELVSTWPRGGKDAEMLKTDNDCGKTTEKDDKNVLA